MTARNASREVVLPGLRAQGSGVVTSRIAPSRISISRSHSEASSIWWLEISSVKPAAQGVEGPPELGAQHGIEPLRGLVEHEQLGPLRRADASETRERSPPDIEATTCDPARRARRCR